MTEDQEGGREGGRGKMRRGNEERVMKKEERGGNETTRVEVGTRR